MSEVQRFNNLGCPCLNGCFVDSSDYDDALSQLAALREELFIRAGNIGKLTGERDDLEQRLADAERRNVLPKDWADQLFAEMERRLELSKQYHQDHLVNDDTQIGVEFAIEWVTAALNKPEEAKS